MSTIQVPQSPQVFSEERPQFANGKQTKLYNDMQDYVRSFASVLAMSAWYCATPLHCNYMQGQCHAVVVMLLLDLGPWDQSLSGISIQ